MSVTASEISAATSALPPMPVQVSIEPIEPTEPTEPIPGATSRPSARLPSTIPA